MRLFCAVELPEDVRERAAGHLAQLRRTAAAGETRVGWERAEKLHVTMKFFGEVEQSRVEDLAGAVGRAAGGAGAAFDLVLEEAGTFPRRGAARVLWLGVADSSGELARLHARLEDECAAAGFAREARAFHPHITIARLRTGGAGARALTEAHKALGFDPVQFTVSELALLRSELGPGGSRYTVLSRHALGGG